MHRAPSLPCATLTTLLLTPHPTMLHHIDRTTPYAGPRRGLPRPPHRIASSPSALTFPPTTPPAVVPNVKTPLIPPGGGAPPLTGGARPVVKTNHVHISQPAMSDVLLSPPSLLCTSPHLSLPPILTCPTRHQPFDRQILAHFRTTMFSPFLRHTMPHPCAISIDRYDGAPQHGAPPPRPVPSPGSQLLRAPVATR